MGAGLEKNQLLVKTMLIKGKQAKITRDFPVYTPKEEYNPAVNF